MICFNRNLILEIMKSKSSLFYLLSIVVLISCQDKIQEPPIIQSDMFACHRTLEWDEIKTRDALIGIWDLEFIGCYFYDPYTAYVIDMGISIEFMPDSTLIVRLKDSITQVSVWQIVDGDGDLFELDEEPFVQQLGGRIWFCDNRVEFNESYRDICDHWFVKKG